MNNKHTQPIREINGDDKLSISQRLMYLLSNALKNMRPRRHSIKVSHYHPESITDAMAVASPSRSLTLSFLNQGLKNIIPVGNIRVLDIGCGSGFISDVLARSGYQGIYTGLDISDRFRETFADEDSFERSFINADAHTFTSDIAYDVVFSFSALEHIPDDAVLINHLNSVVKDNGVHLHIVPSAWGLPLYLWHGLRQYTLSDIEDRFGTQNLKIYALGGAFSFLLHFTFITILEMLLGLSVRKKFCKFYMLMHRMCLRLDRMLPFAPSAYVVIKTIVRKDDITSQQSEVPL